MQIGNMLASYPPVLQLTTVRPVIAYLRAIPLDFQPLRSPPRGRCMDGVGGWTRAGSLRTMTLAQSVKEPARPFSHLPALLTSAFAALAHWLDRRSAARLPLLLVGLLFARGRHTVTSWFRAAGIADDYRPAYATVA